MRINVTPETSFGTINEFDSFDLNFTQRNKFIEINDAYKLGDDDIPKEGGFSNTNIVKVGLSPLFDDSSFMDFSINPTKNETRGRHCYSNKFVYNNLQRLCYEVLEPLVDFIGEKPIINSGLLFYQNPGKVKSESFFFDQIQGNAVVFSYPFDTTKKKIVDSFNFISEFCLFDKLIFDNTETSYNVPTVSVSVNENKRKLKFRVRG